MTTRLKWMTVAIGTAVIASTLALWFLWLGPQHRVLIVGSTTTTQDTGLLDVLQGEYTRQTGRPLRIVVAGTGAINASLLRGSWYKETGSGQANTLRVAAQFAGYALTDEATWNLLQWQGLTGNLTVVVRDSARMKNPYGVIPIKAAVHPKAYEEGALAFAAWLTGAAGQAVVANFQVAGKPAFYPDAGDPNA